MPAPHQESPLNALPPVVWALALPVIAMELVLSLSGAGLIGGQAGVGWRLQAMERFGFFPDLLREMVARGEYPARHLLRLAAYPFVHLGVTHALFVTVILLALGKFVGEVFRWWAIVAVFFAASIGAALIYAAIPGLTTPLIGGYPGTYGLIGAFTFLLWVRLTRLGDSGIGAFSMIGFLMGVSLLFGLLFGGGTDWVADLAGFAVGFLLSFVVSPGGWARVRARLRQR
jgi:membrane associated rhomboid family serine protease